MKSIIIISLLIAWASVRSQTCGSQNTYELCTGTGVPEKDKYCCWNSNTNTCSQANEASSVQIKVPLETCGNKAITADPKGCKVGTEPADEAACKNLKPTNTNNFCCWDASSGKCASSSTNQKLIATCGTKVGGVGDTDSCGLKTSSGQTACISEGAASEGNYCCWASNECVEANTNMEPNSECGDAVSEGGLFDCQKESEPTSQTTCTSTNSSTLNEYCCWDDSGVVGSKCISTEEDDATSLKTACGAVGSGSTDSSLYLMTASLFLVLLLF